MALLKVIEWSDNSHNTLVYKIDTKKNVIARGSALTVREGQAAVFCDKGRMADVFLPGYYKLDTDSLPVLTALLSWKYGFETPFKSEVYFVSTNRFTKQRWGTANPIMLRDPDFGAVRVRGYGTYSFRVKDPYVFMTELSGSHSTYRTEDISDHIRSMLVMAISDALGESGISVVDMAANLMELSDAVKASLEKSWGWSCPTSISKTSPCPRSWKKPWTKTRAWACFGGIWTSIPVWRRRTRSRTRQKTRVRRAARWARAWASAWACR